MSARLRTGGGRTQRWLCAALAVWSLASVAGAETQPTAPQPPAQGMALGYDLADFHYSGPASSRHLLGALSSELYTAVLNGACAGGEGDDEVVMLESDPRVLGEVDDELSRQSGPAFDPATTTPGRRLAPTHKVQGELAIEGGQVTIHYRVLSVADGGIVAESRRSGPATAFFDVLNGALTDLMRALCDSGGDWLGVVTVEEAAHLDVPSTRPGEPGARIDGRLSLVIRLGRLGTVGVLSWSNTIAGRDGSMQSVASGRVPVAVTIVATGTRLTLEVGQVSTRGTATARMAGGGYSGPESVQLGPWSARGAARAGSDRQSGSFSEPVPGGTRRIGWELQRRRQPGPR